MITGMSETNDERPVAPGIAKAMQNARGFRELSQHPRRHRWTLPSDRDETHSEPETDER